LECLAYLVILNGIQLHELAALLGDSWKSAEPAREEALVETRLLERVPLLDARREAIARGHVLKVSDPRGDHRDGDVPRHPADHVGRLAQTALALGL
jgi:hypothetical protein